MVRYQGNLADNLLKQLNDVKAEIRRLNGEVDKLQDDWEAVVDERNQNYYSKPEEWKLSEEGQRVMARYDRQMEAIDELLWRLGNQLVALDFEEQELEADWRAVRDI